jgi:hypothetical protein
VIVWRGEGTLVYQRRFGGAESELLPLLREAVPFGAVCERLANGRTQGEAVKLGFELLSRWVGDGLLVQPDRLPDYTRM